jgi:hypothetical protein
MKIGIIGTGRMGSALGKRWARAGHEVMFGSRTPEKAHTLSEQVGFGAQGGSTEQAVLFADVIVLAVPFRAAQEVLYALGDLGGKILIECTNDFNADDITSAENIVSWACNARVVKAFNTIFDPILASDKLSDLGSVFIVGDDDAAKATVGTLVRDAGFEPVDTGGLADAHYLDTLVRLIVHLNGGLDGKRNINFHIRRVV